MLSYLDDDAFVDFVLEKGKIPFLVRGNIACSSHFDFARFGGIKIAGPNYHVRAIAEDLETKTSGPIHIYELTDEAVFRGEIEIPEKTKTGISKALFGLEVWADFMCVAVGNPRIIIEIQHPINAIIAARSVFDVSSFNKWASLFEIYGCLAVDERSKLRRAMWWYRKACTAAYYSVFDSYTANWNCLEIMCGVGNKTHKGPEVDKNIQEYLKGKQEIKGSDISNCYHSFVNYSIREQMKDALKKMLVEEKALQIIHQCFEVKPNEDRLYQIRNDINHGNIRENYGSAYRRVYYRGQLLLMIIIELLHKRLGHSVSLGISVNDLAAQLASEAAGEL